MGLSNVILALKERGYSFEKNWSGFSLEKSVDGKRWWLGEIFSDSELAFVKEILGENGFEIRGFHIRATENYNFFRGLFDLIPSLLGFPSRVDEVRVRINICRK